ncbi:hypothetical protein T01_3797 [Trichinella spiralis]|uniref:Uncharacterized protein n=1 Tax=Trichinella spiralis TaxID=6334 RepID=A0A0V1BY32_TRISP|nr:hypothetical protein T01_3797 [Trichinella spiralis]
MLQANRGNFVIAYTIGVEEEEEALVSFNPYRTLALYQQTHNSQLEHKRANWRNRNQQNLSSGLIDFVNYQRLA